MLPLPVQLNGIVFWILAAVQTLQRLHSESVSVFMVLGKICR